MLSTVIESTGIVKWRAMASTLSIHGDDDDAMYYNDRRPKLPHPIDLNLGGRQDVSRRSRGAFNPMFEASPEVKFFEDIEALSRF